MPLYDSWTFQIVNNNKKRKGKKDIVLEFGLLIYCECIYTVWLVSTHADK